MELVDVPVPVPGPGEVLVEMAYAGVNFTDTYRRSGVYANSPTYRTSLPYGLGIEGSGTVAKLGEGVNGYAIGDQVAFTTYAEYTLAPAHRLALAEAAEAHHALASRSTSGKLPIGIGLSEREAYRSSIMESCRRSFILQQEVWWTKDDANGHKSKRQSGEGDSRERALAAGAEGERRPAARSCMGAAKSAA